MTEFFRKLFATDFMPHGYCIRRPEVIWLHASSDSVIALSYFLIPIALVYLVRMRRDLVYPWIFWLFGLFIVSCGATHVLAVYVLWHPVYRLDGLVKAVTALASFPTAIILIRLVPKALLLPSPELLRQQNVALASEVAERKRAEAEVRLLNEALERRVLERTEDLQRSNVELRKLNAELQEAQKALTRQLMLTRSITDNATTSLFITDEKQQCVFMNPAAEKLTGYSLQEVKGRSLQEALHRTGLKGLDDSSALDSVFPEQGRRQGEETFFHKDGHSYEVAFTASVMQESGGVLGTVIEVVDITERKREEAERRGTERLLHAVLDALPVSIIISNQAGRLVQMNRASQRIWGLTAPMSLDVESYREWIGYWPGTGRRVQPHEWPLSRAVQQGEVTNDARFEIERFDDGKRLIVELSAAPVRGENGNILGGVVACMDVTERVLAEAAVRASEATLSAVLDALPIGVLIADQHGRLGRDNAAHRELWGVHPETTNWEQYGEWVGYWPETGARIQAQEWAMSRALLKAEVTKGELVECEQFGTKERRYFLNNAAPIRDAEGMVIAAVVAEMDVTEQRRAEEAIRQSEARFRQLADSMPQMIWTARPDGFLDYYNERWYEFTGFDRSLGGDQSWAPILHPEDVQLCLDSWYAAVKAGQAYQMQYRLWDRHGNRWRWFIGQALPARNESGEIVKWFGSCTDIDEQKRVESELRRANHDLEQFAFSASHDLQEPLRNVAIYSQMVSKRYGSQLDAQAHVFLAYVVEGAHRMSQLVNDLLAYTQAGGLDGERLAATSAEHILEEVRRDMKQAIEESGASLTHDPLPAVAMKATHLRQLFLNLIGNALKYCEDPTPVVHVWAEREKGFWRFSVRDNGIGIDPKYHEQIFGIFKRLHGKEGKYPGTGIGLAICQKIVELYGGRIWVESQLGSGTTFHFLLPAVNDEHG